MTIENVIAERGALTSKDIDFNPRSHRYSVKDTKPKVYIPSVTTITGLLDKPFLVEWSAREAATAAVHAYADHSGSIEDETLDRFIATGRARHREMREEGANVGTAVHQQIKRVLVPGWEPAEDEAVSFDDAGLDAEMAWSAFEEWKVKAIDERGAKIVLCEEIVVHPFGLYVGTPDLVLQVPDGNSHTGSVLEIVDFKTSNQSDDNPCALYPEYLFQISAYRRCLMETSEYDDRFGPHPWGDGLMVGLGKNGWLADTPIPAADMEAYANAFELMAGVIATYRSAERSIRAFNKAEKARRAELLAATE